MFLLSVFDSWWSNILVWLGNLQKTLLGRIVVKSVIKQIKYLVHWKTVVCFFLYNMLVRDWAWVFVQKSVVVLYWNCFLLHLILGILLWIPKFKEWADLSIGKRSPLKLLVMALGLFLFPIALRYFEVFLILKDVSQAVLDYGATLDPNMPSSERIDLLDQKWDWYLDKFQDHTLSKRVWLSILSVLKYVG
jgi:hypothetical protein